MKIFSDDGVEFLSVDECNAYEADLKLKKAKEEAEKAAKLREEQQLLEQIRNKVDELNQLVEEYEFSTPKYINYANNGGKLMVVNCEGTMEAFAYMIKSTY